VRDIIACPRQHENVNDPHIQQRLLDERNGTVALTFDFRTWPE